MTRSFRDPAPAKTIASPAPSASASAQEAQAAAREAASRRNAELLQEIYRVVLVSNPSSPSAFGNWLDSLNQGATLEGVYNGFTRSDLQREHENDPKTTADPKVIGVFARELAELLLEFPEVVLPEARDAKPLQSIVPPGMPEQESAPAKTEAGYDRPTQESFKPFAKAAAEPKSKRLAPEEIMGRVAAIFAGASIYTMKRVLGDWGLRVIALRREESPERMRDWYADFAARASKKGVDFGLVLRNDSNRDFHRRWADQATDDQLRWEVLNRLHRILNDAQGMAIPLATK